MSITRENIKSTLRSIMAEESEYQTFFKKALEKAGKSIPSMSDEEKKEFFNKIDAAWNAKGEKNEELTGNQHKLDVDGDGEIEASDLAALRAGEKKEESVNEAPIFFNKQFRQATSDLAKSKSEKDSFTAINKETGNVSTFKSKDARDAAIKAGTHKNESIEESAGCSCGCGGCSESVNEATDRDFEKVYSIFDKKDYFNAKGLAKVQIGNFERALQKNDKGAQLILDKFKGDMDKAKDYIIQVITDRKKEDAFNQYKAFKVAVDLVKSRIHNNSQKYTMALYSAIRNQKFNKWKDIHADVDSLIGESVNEARLGKVAMLKDVEAGRTSSVEGVKISKDLAFEMRMFLQRPMLSRSRTGIAIDNSQMKEAIPMLAKVGIHKRLSSGVKKEFAELLKKYK